MPERRRPVELPSSAPNCAAARARGVERDLHRLGVAERAVVRAVLRVVAHARRGGRGPRAARVADDRSIVMMRAARRTASRTAGRLPFFAPHLDVDVRVLPLPEAAVAEVHAHGPRRNRITHSYERRAPLSAARAGPRTTMRMSRTAAPHAIGISRRGTPSHAAKSRRIGRRADLAGEPTSRARSRCIRPRRGRPSRRARCSSVADTICVATNGHLLLATHPERTNCRASIATDARASRDE